MDERGWRQSANGEFVDVDLSGVRLRNVNLAGAKLTEAFLVNARVSGLITGLVVNNVEVGPLIEAELNRRDPERALMAPSDLAGVHTAWETIGRRWRSLRARAGALPETVLQEQVDDEWSFLQTVRHLVFVADSWVGEVVLGRSDRHPWGVAPSFVTDPAALGLDVRARPSVAQVLSVREERLRLVGDTIAALGTDDLELPRGEHTVLSALQTYFIEEWEHMGYAARDLTTAVSKR